MNYFRAKIYIISIFCLLFIALPLSAQQTEYYQNPEERYRMGLELYHKKQYVAAQKEFEAIVEYSRGANSEMAVNAEYYAAICAIQLFNADADYKLEEFVRNYPTSSRINEAYYTMADFQFKRRKYKKAIEWYEKIDTYKIKGEQLNEYNFRLGYAHFMQKEHKKSSDYLFKVKGANSKYANTAQYYYGHVAYLDGNYQTALVEFEKLKEDKSFGPIVPYYISQIYYQQKKYDKLIEVAVPLMDNVTEKRAAEVAKLIGESYYRKGEYENAITYLKMYQEKGGAMRLADRYQLGYSYYKVGDCENAVSVFNKIINAKNDLAQNAYYHLADCYIKTGDKRAALNAFASAAAMDYNPTIKEDAAFNYAKLAYDLNNPYKEVIKALQDFTEAYPSSVKTKEAYQYLVNAYLTTKDYGNALASLEKVGLQNYEMQMAYQKIAYFRAVELYNAHKWKKALQLFDKSLEYPIKKSFVAQAFYWKGEANYRMKNYDEAIANYEKFQKIDGAANLSEFEISYYNLGYSYFQQKDYAKAAENFRTFLKDLPKDDKRLNDTYLRIGDSYFITKGYFTARRFYNDAAKLNKDNADYATFQMAICSGLLGDNKSRIKELDALSTKYPNSLYIDDALYELGNSYFFELQYKEALTSYQKIIDEHPNSSYLRYAMLKKALVYFNTDENKKAIKVYRDVVEKYPATAEAKQAIANAKNVYVTIGDVDEYVDWVSGLAWADVSRASLDSTTYQAAELQFHSNNCESAIKSFNSYLSKYEDGYFKVNANFYRAQCYYEDGETDKAVEGYEFVISSPRNAFTEEALLKAGRIYYTDSNYARATEVYGELELKAELPQNIAEARTGIMRSSFALENTEKATKYAEMVLASDKVNPEVIAEAHSIVAKSAYKGGSLKSAMDAFFRTREVGEGDLKAEAIYYIAKIQYEQGNYDESQKTIVGLVKEMPSYKYWSAKSFIVLAGIYWKKEDIYQANFTLQNLIDNYDNEEVKQEALALMQEILEDERQKREKLRQDSIQSELQIEEAPPIEGANDDEEVPIEGSEEDIEDIENTNDENTEQDEE